MVSVFTSKNEVNVTMEIQIGLKLKDVSEVDLST
jgi:hypothetical protein